MGHHQRWTGRLSDGLRRHPAGPEDWHFPVPDRQRIAPIRPVDVANTQSLRSANVDRRPVHGWIAPRDPDRRGNEVRGDWSHGDDERTAKHPSGPAGDGGPVHRHVAIALEMTQGNAGTEQLLFEREAAPKQEGDEPTSTVRCWSARRPAHHPDRRDIAARPCAGRHPGPRTGAPVSRDR